MKKSSTFKLETYKNLTESSQKKKHFEGDKIFKNIFPVKIRIVFKKEIWSQKQEYLLHVNGNKTTTWMKTSFIKYFYCVLEIGESMSAEIVSNLIWTGVQASI